MEKKKLCADTLNQLLVFFQGGEKSDTRLNSHTADHIRTHALQRGMMEDGAGRMFDPEGEVASAVDETGVKYACFKEIEAHGHPAVEKVMVAEGVVPLRSVNQDDAFDVLYQAIDNGMAIQFEIA